MIFSQAPINKHQITNKFQYSMSKSLKFSDFEIGHYLKFDVWTLMLTSKGGSL